jgi:hypothetical protein
MMASLEMLATLLEVLETELRRWLAQPHRWPLASPNQEALQQGAQDLSRQAAALRNERPMLIIMLMGGTGVGKSSLLNALARGNIAEAAFTRPTTREPIVYLHRHLDASRLDEALRGCKLIRHEQPGLEFKVLVDTPDLDSNETIHRDRFQAVLPTADIVLYVGSQEKYHDQAGWELFLEHRQRRAFAFVLNKWDRCLAQSSTGLRPDEDLLRDLRNTGFTDPLLFRTCAQAWAASNGTPPPNLPAEEQFPALAAWLEQGLTQREMAAIRHQGIAQLFEQLRSTLQALQPPDVSGSAAKTWSAWQQTLREEARIQAELLLACIAPHQKLIERRLSQAIGHPFRGLMGLYARLLDFGRQGFFRSRLPQLQGRAAETAPTCLDDLAGFGRSCARDTFQRSIQARLRALGDRLVAQADDAELPIGGLGADLSAQLLALSEESYAEAVTRTLHLAEQSLAGEASWRKKFRFLWTWLGDLVPLAIFVLVLMWQLYAKFFTNAYVSVGDLVLLPPVAALLGMTLLYWLYRWTVPITWSRLTPLAGRQLRQGLRADLATALQGLPEHQAILLAEERRQVGQLLEQVERGVQNVQQQEKLAQVAVLYSQSV